jgi:hypothetical protein
MSGMDPMLCCTGGGAVFAARPGAMFYDDARRTSGTISEVMDNIRYYGAQPIPAPVPGFSEELLAEFVGETAQIPGWLERAYLKRQALYVGR